MKRKPEATDRMLKIEKIQERNKRRIIEFLKLDIVRHVFAFYDVQHDPAHTTMYAAIKEQEIKGYVLIYNGTDVESVVLEGEDEVADALIEHAPQDRFILHAPPNLVPAVQSRFPQSRCYVENWMLVEKGHSKSFKSESVRKLSTRHDASELALLISSRKDRPEQALKKYAEWISRMPVYGFFLEDRLVSYAGSFLQLPQIWMIGGVYTHPDYRNKGCATAAVSAITEEALRQSEKAALFVRADNCPAIKAYEKIGYRKIGEKAWIDMGTGLRP
jgi:RimJ/RimL family protein N-acetyltransferase